MILTTAELLAGIALATLTLRDVFDTVVVPGGSHATLRITRRLVFLLLPVWRAARGRDRGLSTAFAPLTLVLSFVLWMSLLTLAFALIGYALGRHFQPALTSFPDALYVLGSALVTIGLSEINATGAARWVVLAAGFCGLAVMTMAVTYLLEVQSSIARRDTGIFKLATAAGQPPSALALLEKYRAIGSDGELAAILRDGRDWCATVRQSHTAHPSLIYFRSIGTGAGWPAALGAILDLALIIEHWIDRPELRGLAVLLREDGTRMAADICALIGIHPLSQPETADQARAALRRLAAAGYPLRDAATPEEWLRLRQDHAGWVGALADHLGRPAALLVPEPGQARFEALS